MRSPGPSLVISVFFTSLISLLVPTIASAAVAGVYTYDPESNTQDGFPTPVVTTLTQVSTTVAGPPSLVVPISPNLTDANARTDGDRPTPTCSEVTRFNMFWPFLTFILAYLTHPLNGPIETRTVYQTHVLITPVGPVFDLVDLCCDILYPPTQHCSHPSSRGSLEGTPGVGKPKLSFRQAIHMAVHTRLNPSLPPLILPGAHNRDSEPITQRWDGRKITLRLFLTAFSVLQFIKICAYRDTGLGFVWIIMVFVPWLVLELLFQTFNENARRSRPSSASTSCQCEPRCFSPPDKKKLFIQRAFVVTTYTISLLIWLFLGFTILYTLQHKWFNPEVLTNQIFFILFMFSTSQIYVIFVSGVVLPANHRKVQSFISRGICFCVVSHVLVLLWFFSLYDLSGSSKPAWTEMLP
ncbi:hypothetical protein DFP73DRAFT_567290 [Morchella snyderi]|nr:hypothetical protein DFP73DRAFT_567290 [Morchella snyderi]